MGFDITQSAYGITSAVSNLDKIRRIPLSQLDENTKNFYALTNIDELAGSIEMIGLLDPIRVVVSDKTVPLYRIVSGHRRYAAYTKLHLSGKEGYDKIPAIVMENLDDLKETFALVTANSSARELTYREKLRQEQLLRETLLAMKAQGTEIPTNLSTYIAEQIGVSRNEVSRMHSVNENLIPEAREQVERGEMNASTAYALSRKTEQEQKAAVATAAKPAEKEQKPVEVQHQKDLTEKRKLLEGFIAHMGDLFLTKHVVEATSRSDAVAALRTANRNCGGNGGQYEWTADNAGVNFIPPGGSSWESASWTTVYDEIARQAISKCYSLRIWRKTEPLAQDATSPDKQ